MAHPHMPVPKLKKPTKIKPILSPPRTGNKKRVGNPNWGRPMDWNGPIDPVPSAFDKKVESLGLKPERYGHSKELKVWSKEHYRTRFVPENLLDLWGLSLDVIE